MIVGVVSGLMFGKPAYYLSLLWCCAAIFVFMVSREALSADKELIRWSYLHVLCSFYTLTENIFSSQIRTLRLKLLSEAAAEGRLVRGARNQLRMYLTMSIAGAQPIFMYWLTYHLIR